jgi:hypothetical protein
MSAVFNDNGERGIRVLRNTCGDTTLDFWIASDDVVYLLNRESAPLKAKIEELERRNSEMFGDNQCLGDALAAAAPMENQRIREIVERLRDGAEAAVNRWIEIGRVDQSNLSVAKAAAYEVVLESIK